MTFKLKSGNKPQFKQVGSSPVKHYVDDVPSHNDGHSDDLQTPEEHETGKVESPAKQAKTESFGPSTAFGGVKNPELIKAKKPFSRKVMKDGPKSSYYYKDKDGKTKKGTDDWQPFRKKSPNKLHTKTHTSTQKKKWYVDNYEKHKDKEGFQGAMDKAFGGKTKMKGRTSITEKKSPTKQTDTTYADGSKKSARERAFSKRHTTEKAKGKYWYKIDGKPATKAQYLKYENKPGNMEGGGKQTNHPDVYGKKASNFGRGPKTK